MKRRREEKPDADTDMDINIDKMINQPMDDDHDDSRENAGTEENMPETCRRDPGICGSVNDDEDAELMSLPR